MRQVFQFYINQYIHVALATTALTAVSYVYFVQPLDVPVLLTTFLSTLLGYHFIRWTNNRFQFNAENIWSVLFMTLSFGGILLVLKDLHFYQRLLLIPVGLLTVAYAVPVVRVKNQWQTLRQIPQLKIFVIALAWTLMTVAIPLYNHYTSFDFLVEFLQRFVFIIAVTIPFDIRDYWSDTQDLMTLPQKIGVERSKQVGMLLMMLFFMLIFPMSHLLSYGILSELGVFILVILFLYNVSPDNDKYYTSFWVESTPVLWLLDVWFWYLILH